MACSPFTGKLILLPIVDWIANKCKANVWYVRQIAQFSGDALEMAAWRPLAAD
jgi:hypothetical protein